MGRRRTAVGSTRPCVGKTLNTLVVRSAAKQRGSRNADIENAINAYYQLHGQLNFVTTQALELPIIRFSLALRTVPLQPLHR
jgi:hypothetical protein